MRRSITSQIVHKIAQQLTFREVTSARSCGETLNYVRGLNDMEVCGYVTVNADLMLAIDGPANVLLL
jgi:hypothetical protein